MGDFFSNLLMGFQTIGNFQSVLWILVGVCVGILGGAIPGISPSMAVALLTVILFLISIAAIAYPIISDFVKKKKDHTP